MDAYQQHHRYMRPPPPPTPPSTGDPHLYPHHLHQQPRPPIPPQNTSWYPNQFPYHHPPPPPQSSHSPSPPPPQQWAPPPHSAYPSPQPPQPSHAYPHLPPQNHHFTPPPPPAPPRSHGPLPPQSYPQVNKDWGNPNWGQQQGWDYQAHNNAEDWAARARAWAAAKQMEDQYQQSQFTPVGRPEEQSQFHEQYPQAPNAHYQDIQQQPFHVSGYQQFSVSAALPNQPAAVYPQDSFNSGQPSLASDGRAPYAIESGTSAGGAPSTSPSVHQQEVPSSYSSVTGKGEILEQREHPYKSLPFPSSSSQGGQHHVQSSVAVAGRSVLMEQSFAHGNQAADLTVDLSDQPLNFAPSFTQSYDGNVQSNYATFHDSAGTARGVSPVTSVPSMTSWTPAVATGTVYPPIPSVPPSGPQHDPSVSGTPLPPFGSFPGPSFQPPIPSTAAPYVPAFHPTSGFQGDVYGASNISERPKKASVPNWLKEEIFKNASAITRSSLEHPKQETQSTEDEGVDKSFVKADQADSKSLDSSRSTEEEDDDDEDYAEAARTAAMNQEIKRVLTEVLLKVTDELFDKIATKVLDEDNLTAEAEDSSMTSNHKLPSPSCPPHSIPTASAKVLVPVKANDSKDDDISEKSSSTSPGNVLGLANYASDEDDEIQSSGLLNSGKNVVHQSPVPKFSEYMPNTTENGSSELEILEKSIAHSNGTANSGEISSSVSKNKIDSAPNEPTYSSKVVFEAQEFLNSVDSDKTLGSNRDSGMKANDVKNILAKSEPLGENGGMNKLPKDYFRSRETRIRSDKDNLHERKRSNCGRDVKEAENRSRADEKGDDSHGRHDEKHQRKEKKDDPDGIKEKMKDHSDKNVEKVKESEARKRPSHLDVKEDRKEAGKLHRAGSKEDDNKKRDRAKGEDGARHKPSSDSGRHKRRRSSSVSSKDRHNKDNESSDEASYDSKRKAQSRKRHLSPSPDKSRRRKVSRSPHSKHSQRRHSPHSSFETTRRRRSRSRSPSRRHR